MPPTAAMTNYNLEESAGLTGNVSFEVPRSSRRGLLSAPLRVCWGGRGFPVKLQPGTPQRRGHRPRMRYVLFFLLLLLLPPPGSRKHQRQTWVGSKCSLKKPTTLRNGRPNSSPWWRAKTKFGTRTCFHFPGMGCLGQLQLSNNSVSADFLFYFFLCCTNKQ